MKVLLFNVTTVLDVLYCLFCMHTQIINYKKVNRSNLDHSYTGKLSYIDHYAEKNETTNFSVIDSDFNIY